MPRSIPLPLSTPAPRPPADAAEAPGRHRTRAILTRLVQVLAEEAPPGELDALEAAARLVDDDADRSLLLRAIDDGRRVRDMLARRERRERETQALYQTARDLTSLRDVDEVLTAIVDRARRLFGSDSTYIALIDETSGDAYMRVTSGTVTPAIRSVRQPPGWGVGGRVIQTGQPFATSNYQADPRIRRRPSVASAVGEDGVVSIAGVPMRVGNRVIGALFAADRRERDFEQSEIALLSSLADHASVVIENARLFAQVRDATDGLRAVHRQLSAQRRALEQTSAAHEMLMPLALTRADLGEFAATLARALRGTVVLVNKDAQVLATAGTAGEPAPDTVRALDTRPDGGPDGGPAAGARVRGGSATVPVRAGPEAFGHLLFRRRAPLADAERRTLERAAQTAALLMLMERQTYLVEEELRREIVADLLADREPDWESFQRRADRFRVLPAGEPHVVAVASSAAPRRLLVEGAGDLATERGGVAGEYTGRVVLLLPGRDAGAVARDASHRLGRRLGAPVTVGACGPADDPPGIRARYPGAARCHALLLALGRGGSGSGLDELGVVGMVLENATVRQLRAVVDQAIGPLLAYDSAHGSALVATAERFFACGHSPPAAARQLGVHVNTVYQRLERIDRVLGGPQWRKPHGAVETQMALQLYRLMVDPPAAPH